MTSWSFISMEEDLSLEVQISIKITWESKTYIEISSK